MQEQIALYVRSLKNRKVWCLSRRGSSPRKFLYLSFIHTSCNTLRQRYYYYYFSCHRPILPGNSLEPTVIPTAQASSFTQQYFPYNVWCSKYYYYYYYYYYYVLIFWGRSFEKSAVIECLQNMTALFVFFISELNSTPVSFKLM
jgi:hypothetical protein